MERMFHFGNQVLQIPSTCLKMGVVNLTPDSFSDGGKYQTVDDVLRQAERFLEKGFSLLDIGGESTRPGATPITIFEEIKRIKNALIALKRTFPELPLSLDTRHADVAKCGLDLGVDIINDISGGYEKMFKTVASYNAGYVLMHAKAPPKVMQQSQYLDYENIHVEIISFLKKQMDRAVDCGIKQEFIMLDPGIGFSKTAQHNMQIVQNVELYVNALPQAWLIGHSRKRFMSEFFPNLSRDEATVFLTQQMLEKQLPLIFRLHN